MVAFTDEGHFVGETARMENSKNPEYTIYDAKRLMGKNFSDQQV